MPEPTLAIRVENLERRVELLEALPERVGAVELQIVQLRSEMREEFSAVRREFRGEIQAVREELRAEIKAESEAIRTELQAEIRHGDEETRRYMRVLHEEVLARIANIREARPRRRKQ